MERKRVGEIVLAIVITMIPVSIFAYIVHRRNMRWIDDFVRRMKQ